MSFVAAAIAGSAALGVASSAIGAKGQKDAANAAAGASLAQQNQTRTDLMPWTRGGGLANSRLMALLGLGSGIDEQDPRFKKIFDRYVARGDENSKRMYGVGLFDPAADVQSRDRLFDRYRELAMEELKAQGIGQDETYGSLIEPFTGEDVATDPGYQFGLSEGQKAIERAAAARGRFDSGDTLKALTRFGQDYAGTKFNEAFNRDAATKGQTYGFLSGQSGQGLNAATGVGTMGANATNAANAASMNAADASAAGLMGGANALAGGVSGYLNYKNNQQTLDYLKGIRGGTLSGAGTPFGYKW